MILYPNCKINVGLDILRKREDGFHEIDTLMYPVADLCDILEIVPSSKSGAEFSSSGLAVDCLPENNLCMTAFRLLKERYAIGGVKIHLHKIIPFGAGLGGGSSDAAFVIKGLNQLFGLNLDENEMERYAAELGSDTAFFIKNKAQFSRGRGEVLSVSDVSLAGMTLVIVKPQVGISTQAAYSGIVPHAPSEPLAQRLRSDVAQWQNVVTNAFEKYIFEKYPELEEIKQTLCGMGAVYASMSGSGSAIYGIFRPEVLKIEPVFSNAFVYQCVMQ